MTHLTQLHLSVPRGATCLGSLLRRLCMDFALSALRNQAAGVRAERAKLVIPTRLFLCRKGWSLKTSTRLTTACPVTQREVWPPCAVSCTHCPHPYARGVHKQPPCAPRVPPKRAASAIPLQVRRHVGRSHRGATGVASCSQEQAPWTAPLSRAWGREGSAEKLSLCPHWGGESLAAQLSSLQEQPLKIFIKQGIKIMGK